MIGKSSNSSIPRRDSIRMVQIAKYLTQKPRAGRKTWYMPELPPSQILVFKSACFQRCSPFPPPAVAAVGLRICASARCFIGSWKGSRGSRCSLLCLVWLYPSRPCLQDAVSFIPCSWSRLFWKCRVYGRLYLAPVLPAIANRYAKFYLVVLERGRGKFQVFLCL